MEEKMDSLRLDQTVLLMNEEIELLKALKRLLEEQKELIFQTDVARFTDNIRIEDELLKKIKVVDQERVQMMNQVGRELNIDSQLTITKLIDLVHEPFKIRMKTIKNIFTRLIEDIRQLNIENRFLVKKSMVFVQKNLNVLKDFTKNDYVYSMNGGYGNVVAPVNRLVDTTI